MSEFILAIGPVSPFDLARNMHPVIMDLDADLYDSEHRRHPFAQALAAYRDRWVELTDTGTGQ
jgi:hypothetical protein